MKKSTRRAVMKALAMLGENSFASLPEVGQQVTFEDEPYVVTQVDPFNDGGSERHGLTLKKPEGSALTHVEVDAEGKWSKVPERGPVMEASADRELGVDLSEMDDSERLQRFSELVGQATTLVDNIRRVFHKTVAPEQLALLNKSYTDLRSLLGTTEKKMSAAFASFMYREPVEKDELRAVIIRVAVANGDDDPENKVPGVLDELLGAYSVMYGEKSFINGDAAEKFFQQMFVKHGGQEESYLWPDALGWQRGSGWPKWLLAAVAEVEAEKDKAVRKHFQQHYGSGT